MSSNDLNEQIKICERKDFFRLLEKFVEFNIPLQLRNVLTLNLCDSAVALSTNILQTIDEIQLFMRNDFDKKMIKPSEKMEDYLGIFVKRQKDFQLLSGQKRMLYVIYERCRTLYNIDDRQMSPNVSTIQSKSTVPLNPTVRIQNCKDVSSTSFQKDVVPSTSFTSDVLSLTQTQQPSNVSRSESNIGEPVDQVKNMFDDLYTWMTKQDYLEEVLMFANVLFYF